MTHDHDVGDDPLATLDLHAWHVPPPVPVHAPSLVVRALSPAAAASRRPRLAWLVAAIVLANAAIAALIVIIVARTPASPTTVTVAPAGDGSVDARVREVLARLEVEQHELERRLAEVEELRALVTELTDKVHRLEDEAARRDHTVPKPPEHVEHPAPEPARSADSDSCDEVSCVLDDIGPCCAKFRKPPAPAIKSTLPESLDRSSIASGVGSVKAAVAACGNRSTAHGTVRVHVRVGANGLVTHVTVEATPDPALGACVEATIKRAVFPRTQSGGSFSYPFLF